MPTPPDTRTRAHLADRQPTSPLRPELAAEIVRVPLAAIDLSGGAYATRVDLRRDAMVESLERDGQINPVHLLATSAGVPLEIVCGHRRINALQHMGRPDVLAVVHAGLEPAEAWRLAWTDNQDRKTMSQADRRFTIAKLLHAGHNQATVSAMLGVHKSMVSRDAAWTHLPDSVRRAVGEDGFSFSHASELLPFAAHPRMADAGDLLRTFRKAPVDVPTFRKQVRRFFRPEKPAAVPGLRVAGGRITIDGARFDPSQWSAGQRELALSLLQPVIQALQEPGVG